MINRSTFYSHYNSKYDLAGKIAHDFLDEFKSLADFKLYNKETFKKMLNDKNMILNDLYEQRMTILGLWNIHTENIHLYEDMQVIIKQKYIDLLEMDEVKEDRNIEYEAFICASIFLSTLRFTLKNQKFYGVDEIIEGIRNFQSYFFPDSIINNNNKS